jgi:ABC-2 type transport system permease protein
VSARVSRVGAIVVKELAELRRNRSALLPVVLISGLAVVLPFFIAVAVPALVGEPLSGDSDFEALARQGVLPVDRFLGDTEARIQAFLFQRFLLLQVLVPVTGAMAFAAYSLIGEKQGRTLEPLLATPITTAELLVGKIIGAMLPSLAIMVAGVVIYIAGIAALALPHVASYVVNVRSLLLVGLVAPLAGLVSLQVAVLISSRVNDPRTAQQFGGLLVLPLTALFLVMFTGMLALTVQLVLVLALALLLAWLVLLLVSVRLFDREAILTRWK